MPEPLRITVPHRLGKEGARARIDGSLAKLQGQLATVGATAETSWQEDVLHLLVRALAQTITGRIVVMAESVLVEIDLPPLLLSLFGRQIGERIERQGTKLLAKE